MSTFHQPSLFDAPEPPRRAAPMSTAEYVAAHESARRQRAAQGTEHPADGPAWDLFVSEGELPME